MLSIPCNSGVKSWRNKKGPARNTKIKPFIDRYIWEEIIYPSEESILTIALNVLYNKKEKNIYPTYVSKHNSSREKQIILLVIPNGEGWHYIALKQLSALSREITSNYHREFYCLNCLHSSRTENKLKSHQNVCENKDFYNIVMPSETIKILEFNQNQKFDTAARITYADLECLIEKNGWM